MARPRKQDASAVQIKDVIIDAALQVIIQEGVTGATYRRIATQAGVSPGTMTYHFSSINEILAAAFIRMTEGIAQVYQDKLSAADSQEQAREVVADLICGEIWQASGQMLLIFELYSFASRHPEYRSIMDNWMALSRQALQIHFDEKTSRSLDALIEGFIIHNTLSLQAVGRADILALIKAVS